MRMAADSEPEPEVSEGVPPQTLEEFLGAAHAVLREDLEKLGVGVVEDLQELEAEDIERLASKLKKVQARQFVRRMAALQGTSTAGRAGPFKALALVIGVKDYQHVNPLDNTLNDADDVAAMFEEIGCGVMKLTDTTQDGSVTKNLMKMLSKAGHD